MKRKQLYLSLFLAVVLTAMALVITLEASADGTPDVMVNGASEKDADPGEQVSYEIEVDNRGDTDDFDIKLKYDNPDGSWTVETSENTLHIVADGSKSFYVYVKPHDNGTAPDAGEEIEVEAVVTAQTGGASDSETVTTRCNPVYAVEFSVSSQMKTARPGYDDPDTVVFTIQITNTGNGEDDFSCEVNESYTKGNIYDWAEITKGAVISDLAADSSATVEIEITVRPYDEDHDATPGEKDFWIHAYSRGARDNGKEVVNETTDFFKATVDVEPYYHVVIDALDSHTPELEEGENDSFRIKVENLGNDKDTISMVKDGDDDGRYSSWQEFESSSVELEPDTSAKVNMTITVNGGDDAETGIYNFYYHGKSQKGAGVESEEEFNSIEVMESYGVAVEVNTENMNAEPEEVVSFPIQVTNTGNTRTDVALPKPQEPGQGWTVYWTASSGSEDPITEVNNLDPDDTVRIYIRVEVGSKADVGTHRIPFEVSVGSGDDKVYAHGNVSVTVEVVYGVQLSCDSPTSRAEPGEQRSYLVTVKNTGNDWDNFTYQVIDPESLDWAYLDEENVTESTPGEPNGYNRSTGRFTLEPDHSIEVTFIVSVPPYTQDEHDAEVDYEYRIELKFRSVAD